MKLIVQGTDVGLERVGRMTSLNYIFLSDNARLTDAGLAYLKGLSDLLRHDTGSHGELIRIY